MQTPRRYAPMGGSFAPVWVAGFTWNGWQASAVYATGAAVFPKECSWYAECQVSQLGSACVHHPLLADNRIKSAKSIVQIINPPGH